MKTQYHLHTLQRLCSALSAIVLLVALATSCSKTDTETMNTQSTDTQPVIEPLALIAGTYTDTDSRGVYQLTYNPASQSFSSPSLLTELGNPSYGTASADQQHLYFVVEYSEGQLQAFRRNQEEPGLTPLNGAATQGAHPCYLALSPDEKHLAVANYSTGNVAVFTIDTTGAIEPTPQMLQHEGSGANAARQEGPHAHWAQWSPEGDFLYVVDLGIDQVMAYPFNQR